MKISWKSQIKNIINIGICSILFIISGCSQIATTDIPVFTVQKISFTDTVSGVGILEPVNEKIIQTPRRTWGPIKELAKEGIQVKKDDILVKIDTRQLEENTKWEKRSLLMKNINFKKSMHHNDLRIQENKIDLQQKERSLSHYELKLSLLEDGSDPLEIQNNKIGIEKSKNQLSLQKDKFSNYESLKQKGFMSKIEYENLKLSIEKSKIQIKKFQNSLDKMIEGPEKIDVDKNKFSVQKTKLDLKLFRENVHSEKKINELELKKKKYSIERAESQIKSSEKRIERCTIKAPIDGTLLYVNGWNGKPRIGMNVWQGMSLVKITDFSELKITGKIRETDIDRVHIGDSVEVTVDAFAEQTFTGKISQIDKLATPKDPSDSKGQKEFGLTILLDAQKEVFVPNMSVNFNILSKTYENVFKIPHECVFSDKEDLFVFVKGITGFKKQKISPVGKNEHWFFVSKDLNNNTELALIDPEKI